MIVRRDPLNGKEEVLVESVKAAFSVLKDEIAFLADFAEPDNDIPLFRVVYGERDDAVDKSIYSFHPLTRQLRKVLDIPAEMDYHLSPDERYLLQVHVDEKGDGTGLAQTLLLTDLTTYKTRKLLRLSGDETFNADKSGKSGEYGIFGAVVDVSWVDSDTVCYTVFRQSEKDGQRTPNEDPSLPSYDALPKYRREMDL